MISFYYLIYAQNAYSIRCVYFLSITLLTHQHCEHPEHREHYEYSALKAAPQLWCVVARILRCMVYKACSSLLVYVKERSCYVHEGRS